MRNQIELKAAVRAVVNRHGGVRKAARALEINYAYLSRLQSGEKVDPSPEVLRKLGLRKVVTYETIAPKRAVLEFRGESLEFK